MKRVITIDGKTTLKPRKELKWFIGVQEQKLRKVDDKRHWSLVPDGYLLKRLKEEVIELEQALDTRARGYDRQAEILSECADVANFAMMIADKQRYC